MNTFVFTLLTWTHLFLLCLNFVYMDTFVFKLCLQNTLGHFHQDCLLFTVVVLFLFVVVVVYN